MMLIVIVISIIIITHRGRGDGSFEAVRRYDYGYDCGYDDDYSCDYNYYIVDEVFGSFEAVRENEPLLHWYKVRASRRLLTIGLKQRSHFTIVVTVTVVAVTVSPYHQPQGRTVPRIVQSRR